MTASPEQFLVTIRESDRSFSFSVEPPTSNDEEDFIGKEDPAVQDSATIISNSFRDLSDDWTRIAIGFFEIVPLLSEFGTHFADAQLGNNVYQLTKEISVKSEKSTDEKGVTTERFYVPAREYQRLAKEIAAGRTFSEAAVVVKRSALTALLAEYEAFILRLVSLCARCRPEAFYGSEISLKPSDLEDYETLEELKQEIVTRRVDDFLHGISHKEALEKVGKRFDVNLLSNRKLIAEFVEVCQRRNLISHAGSLVNKRYQRICSEAGCDSSQMLSLGEAVSVDRKYLRRATARVFQVGFFTLHLLWQKLTQRQSDSDAAIVSVTHDFLEKDLTKMAIRVADFSLSRKNRPFDRSHAYILINKAQAFKFSEHLSSDEKKVKVRDTLSVRDWKESSALTKLALACLHEDYENIASLIRSAVNDPESPLVYSYIFTWNIFREARDHSGFMEAVFDTFGVTKALPAPK